MTKMETFIVDSAAAPPAVPSRLAESATPDISQSLGNLRAELAAAIEARRLADERAAAAAGIAARADSARRDAREEVARLQVAQHEAERVMIEARARAISEALRAGSELPAAALPGMVDSAPLAAATAAFRAVEAAASDLFGERDAARAAAAEATAVCRQIVDRIIIAEARAIAAEWVAAVQLSWRLQDRLTGLAAIGGELLPHAFQTEILNQIDRRRVAIAEDGLNLERHNYDASLDRMAAAEEKRWLDYGRRLMNDAAATFDAAELPQ
jgi:hypothetical protein